MNGMLMGYTISNQTWQLEIPQSGWFFLAGKSSIATSKM